MRSAPPQRVQVPAMPSRGKLPAFAPTATPAFKSLTTMVNRLFCLFVLALLATSSNALAQEEPEPASRVLPRYHVEVVVFRNLNPSLYGDELMLPQSTPAVSVDGDDAGNAAFSPLSERPQVSYGKFEQVAAGDLKLTNIFSWMRSSSNYSPLLHTGWIQPGYSRREAVPVALSGAAKGWWFDGGVTLSLERFLRLNFELQLYGENEPTVFRLEQGRKMRSRTVHYIDHPRFGVIAAIYPVN